MTLRAPALVVIRGGDIGARYVRQLLRAVARGRLATDRIVVVDHDAGCAASTIARGERLVHLEIAEWADWLDENLDRFGRDDQLVPYHWAPHLLAGWLERQARRRGAVSVPGGAVPARGVPYERSTRDGGLALSYATWTCPPTCIEPALCPHTRGPKDWSLAAHLAAPLAGDPFDERVVLPSLHFVFGVATVPVTAIHAARDRVLAGLAAGPRRYLVATASHCHGLARAIEVRPGPGRQPDLLGFTEGGVR
jgi:hypothetical protein